MNDKNEIYLKFPVVLREKIKNGQVVFPKDTQYEYTPIKAYRGIAREEDDFAPVNRMDFRSYAELGKKRTRGSRVDASCPEYYGVSLFMKKELVENVLHFPNPHKKMAAGYVNQEGGPQHTNSATEHICWWLYENADLGSFKII